ncbi:MAG: molybdopterin-synthase adenylyltransferase MoeB [Xanthomonadales bacterium]|nr:molybdopterin-synthase adenylyltransferase MoeB [Xanthomonadales bacterium]
MKARDRRLAQLRVAIPEIAPAQALALLQRGAVLVDVREHGEIAQGLADGAVALARDSLELCIEDLAPDPAQPLLVICGSGVRSLFAAHSLRELGYQDVRSVAGGFNRWKDEGLPFHLPKLLDADARLRYARQIILPEVGEAGQQKLLDARVLLVGAGGLGAPAALYLAAAGIGTLGLVDHDLVERSNLNRQVIHTDDRVGEPKVESARRALLALNPAVRVQTHPVRLAPENVEDIFSGYDVIVDGCDNFATHYLANDACVRLGLPCVHGSIFRYDAQISVFWPAAPGGGPCYRCLYAEPPPPELAPSCNEAGVLGVVPGVVGLLEATEALKLVLGVGRPLVGRLLCYDALNLSFHELNVRPDPACACCGAGKTFPGYGKYGQSCNAAI